MLHFLTFIYQKRFPNHIHFTMSYLSKHALFPPHINQLPNANLGIIVVIPCFDEPDIIPTLMSLKNCTIPDKRVEVIVHINCALNTPQAVINRNKNTLEICQKWMSQNSSEELQFHVIYHDDLPPKHAGVGLARKVGLDEAVYRFEQIGAKNGILVCFDADAVCEQNYLKAIENHFKNHPKTPACSIHYEHPIEGNTYSLDIYNAIIEYELHLRYFINIQKYTGHPFAFQTVGSSMAVRSEAYKKQGGMNKRKAGEDFYFIQKFIQLGNFTALTTTKVIPSPRISHRVPFGTGRSITQQIANKGQHLMTYNPLIFDDLKSFFEQIEVLYTINSAAISAFIAQQNIPIRQFLTTLPFEKKVIEIQKNTTSFNRFKHRFFLWFNAFMVMKYTHFARDNFYKNVPIRAAAIWLCQHFYQEHKSNNTPKEILQWMRLKDKNLV